MSYGSAALRACLAASMTVLAFAVAPARPVHSADRASDLGRWSKAHAVFELSLPPRLSEEMHVAAQKAAAGWSTVGVPCTRAQLSVVASSTATELAERDGVNRIVWHERAWCRSGARRVGGCYDPRVAALTTVYYAEESEPGRPRRIVEADIELNAVNFSWNGRAAPNPSLLLGDVDLQHVLMHEFGHVLGFADQPPALNALSIMSAPTGKPSVRNKLPGQDRRQLCEAYPALRRRPMERPAR